MLEILNATYGDKDVKNIIKSKLNKDRLSLSINNDIFQGDPNPGRLKHLSINYILDGVTYDKRYQEGSYINIPDKDYIIDFVIPTYNRVDELRLELSSLIAQSNKNWTATVVIDGENKKIIDLVDQLNTEIGYPKIKYFETGIRYNDWGHTPREIGKQMSEGDYIIMTGDDNYYVPSFVNEFLSRTGDQPGIIYCDMLHNGYNYRYFNTSTSSGCIDMGCFATRKDLAQNLKLKTIFTADSQFVLDLIEKHPEENIVKIDKILFVHN